MYDNSHVTSYANISSRPCRMQYSRWSLNSPSVGEPCSQESINSLSSPFYFSQTQRPVQELTVDYVNYYPSSVSSTSSSRLSHYERPRSTILSDSTSKTQSTFHVNELRQRYEPKAVIGIVKPMVHQLSYNQLNSNINNSENKFPDIPIKPPYSYDSTRSIYPPPIPTPTLSASTSSVIYRTRPPISHHGSNGPPPIAPRRYSSISNNKRASSRRSSRTTSTSSSIGGINEISSKTSTHENEQQQNDSNSGVIIDVKRIEMFYGSVGTLVKAARSIARLYITTTRQLANFEEWSCQQLGVPVWIYNTGANLKRARQVQLMLAQHDSCFAVWSSLISNQAELRSPKENYITCWIPESNMLAVFKFERHDACRLFFRHYYEILENERRMNLANPPPLPDENINNSHEQTNNNNNHMKDVPRRYSRLRTRQDKEQEQQQFELRRCRSLSKIRTVKKSDISGPINFEHVNHIGNNDNQPKQRPLSICGTIRSLHASMSHLPNSSTIIDRIFNQNKKRLSGSFEPRTTAV